MAFCVICKNEKDGEFVTPGKAAIETINRASKARNDTLTIKEGDDVHKTCRKNYIHSWYILHSSPGPSNPLPSPVTRSTHGKFDFRHNCFLCGQPVTEREKIRKNASEVLSRNKEIDKKIRKEISERTYDEWSLKVLGRLESVNELHAEDAIYHHVCSTNFRTGKDVPKKYQTKESGKENNRKRGRPRDILIDDAYNEVCVKLREYEKDDEQTSISELASYMNSLVGESSKEGYSNFYLKKKILEDFKDEIIISSESGRSDVITFVTNASKILLDFNKQRKENHDEESQKTLILDAAAKIIRNEIKTVKSNMKQYPSFEEIEAPEKIIPKSLKSFLNTLITHKDSDVVMKSIGNVIVQNVRPKSIIAPLHIGLSVTLHRHFGSRYLIDTLNKLGFCSSYSEACKFESCAAVHDGIELNCGESSFIHFIADNVDHNINTLDGMNTFHGMGIIGCVTPGNSLFDSKCITRATISSADVIEAAKIDIKYFTFNHKIKSMIKFETLKSDVALDTTKLIGTLWQYAWLIKPMKPLWNGFMKETHHSNHPGKSAVHFLPMIDLKASDYSCIYSTILFISQQADRYNHDPVLTFDQPLYWKAMEIKTHEKVNNCLQNLVLLLGNFHTCMSFLGSIGTLMTGTGLNAVLELFYGDQTVPHILTGKAFSRATRAHLITIGSLHNLLLMKNLNIDVSEMIDVEEEDEFVSKFQDTMTSNDKLYKLSDFLNNLLSNKISSIHPDLKFTLTSLTTELDKLKTSLDKNKTSKLWFMYLEMVDIFTRLLKAERTGNWYAQLSALRDSLPYFAASGHHLYAKSVYLFLQSMEDLPRSNPTIHKMFENGYHVVRRSDSYWSGISTDLAIEQALMRSLKVTGGLTRGRGFTEIQRAKWVLSTPATTKMRASLERITDVTYESSEQHKTTRSPRLSRDYNDALKVLKYFMENDPFDDKSESLMNIDTKVVADMKVNVYNAKSIGNGIIEKMEGQFIFEYSFCRRDMAVIIKNPTAITYDGEVINIDQQLLFQRLLIIARRDDLTLEQALRYELCSVPASLFNKNGLMREADKAALGIALWERITEQPKEISKDASYVIDGGSLLNMKKWKKGSTFQKICHDYVNYVKGLYGDKCQVVFDGYPVVPTTKDPVHIRRLKGRQGKLVKFNLSSKLTMKKENFLLDKANKQLFLEYLTDYMNLHGIDAKQAYGDADVQIVSAAIEKNKNCEVVLIGEDTDLLILLLHHYDINSSYELFFTTGKSVTNKKIWNIRHAMNCLPDYLLRSLLPFHAFLGCDTVSSIFSIGKGEDPLKKIASNAELQTLFSNFAQSADKKSVAETGEAIMVLLYGGQSGINLDKLRFHLFQKRVATANTAVVSESLPPTSDAVVFHSYRAYHQINVWKGIELDPLDWGWWISNSTMKPITMTASPAPDELLKLISCACKKGCNTGSNCSCRKHGLKCTISCKECKGTSCSNCENIDHSSD